MRSIWIMTCSILMLLVLQPALAENADLKQLEKELKKVHILESTGNTNDVIKAYQSLIKRYPQQPELYNNLAALMATQGQLEQARTYLEQAMNLDHVYATVYENLSAVYVEMARGSYAKALQVGDAPQQLSLKKVELENASANMDVAVVATQKTTPESKQDDDILQTLQDWASAWSAQEVDLYLSFYAPEFRPAKGLSRTRWAAQRGQRLLRPDWVKITLNDVQIKPAENGLARVRFLQNYQSDNYRDKTVKEVLLKRSTEGWQILSEHSL